MPSEPTVFYAGHIKHNPDTGEVALRTIFPEDQGPQMANMAWLVATKNVGARNARSEEVADAAWVDLYVAEPPPMPAPPTPLPTPTPPPSEPVTEPEAE